MSMTKKDFVALADAIREHNRFEHDQFKEQQLESLSVFCKQQNSSFMKDRWLDYIAGNCGQNGGKAA